MNGMHSQIHVKDGQMVVSSTQDCTSIAESTKARHNEGMHGTSELKHAARIPLVMVEKYLIDNNITYHEWSTDKAHIRRMLNDPSLSYFRIWPGAI